MIVKNEEKYLRDCLNSIKPLLDELDSELIIYDTGSVDATVEIAKEFTPQVYTLEWRRDFAWARNHTIDRAKGKWYMWVDADEIYQDVSGIIDFFKSGEYENYTAAYVVWKNLHQDGAVFSYFNPLKLVHLNDKTRWVGKIHEYLTPISPPVINLDNALALHYGYNYDTAESLKMKIARNLPPLRERYIEKPDDPKNLSQLISECRAAGLQEEVRKYIEQGLEQFKDNTDGEYYHIFANDFVRCCYATGKYEEGIDFTQRYFETVTIRHAIAEFIKHNEVHCLQALKRYKEAAEAGAEVLKWMSKRENGKLEMHIMSMFISYEIKKEEIISGIVKNYACAVEFDFAFGWQKNYESTCEITRDKIFSIFAECAITDDRPEDLVKLYDYAVKRLQKDSPDYDNALAIIESSISLPATRAVVTAAFIDKYKNVDDDYIQLQYLRNTGSRESLNYFLSSSKPFHPRFGDVLVAALKHKVNFNGFFENLQITNSNELVSNLAQSNSDLSKVLLEYLQDHPLAKSNISIKMMHFISVLLFALLQKSPYEPGIFEAYVRAYHKYLCIVYSDDVYNENMAKSLPEQDGFAYFAGRAFAYKDIGDLEGFGRNLGIAVQIVPSMRNVIG